MFDNLYKKPGDPIRASDWNALLSLISETQSQPSLPINHRTVTPFSARTSIVGAGFSLRSITKVSSNYLAYFNPGAVHLLNSGSSTQRIIPTIDGRSMDTIPYPSITAVAGPLFLVLKTDSSQQVTSAVLTQNSAETGCKIQIGIFLRTGDTLRYYPSHTGDVIFKNQSGTGGVTIKSQYMGANLLYSTPESTSEIKQRSLLGNAGGTAWGTIHGLLNVPEVSGDAAQDTVEAGVWVSFVEPMSPGVEAHATLQAGQLENGAYGLISKPLLAGTGITMRDDPGTGIIISSTGGSGGGIIVAVGDQVNGDVHVPYPTDVIMVDNFTLTVNPIVNGDGQNVSVLSSWIFVISGSWDTMGLGLDLPPEYWTLSNTQDWMGRQLVQMIPRHPTLVAGEGISIGTSADGMEHIISATGGSGGGGGTTGYTGVFCIGGADYDGAMSTHYRELSFEDGVLKQVSNLTPNGYPPDYP